MNKENISKEELLKINKKLLSTSRHTIKTRFFAKLILHFLNNNLSFELVCYLHELQTSHLIPFTGDNINLLGVSSEIAERELALEIMEEENLSSIENANSIMTVDSVFRIKYQSRFNAILHKYIKIVQDVYNADVSHYLQFYSKKCDCCGQGMESGFFDDYKYYCDSDCLLLEKQKITPSYTMLDWEIEHKENLDSCYWSEWDYQDDDDDEVFDIDGNVFVKNAKGVFQPAD